MSFKDSFGLCGWRRSTAADIYLFTFRDHFYLCNERRFHQEASSTQLSNYCPSSQCVPKWQALVCWHTPFSILCILDGYTDYFRSGGSSVGLLSRLRSGQPRSCGLIPGRGKRLILKAPLPVLGPTKHHIEFVPGCVSRWSEETGDLNWPRISICFPGYDWVNLYLQSLICQHGVHRDSFTSFTLTGRKLI